MAVVSESMDSNVFGICETNDFSSYRLCNSIRCSQEDTDFFQLTLISILPCDPAVRVFLADAELRTQLNITVSKTTNNIPFLDPAMGSLNIRFERTSDMTAIGLGVSQNGTRGKPEWD